MKKIINGETDNYIQNSKVTSNVHIRVKYNICSSKKRCLFEILHHVSAQCVWPVDLLRIWPVGSQTPKTGQNSFAGAPDPVR